jgi:hypothetical protein
MKIFLSKGRLVVSREIKYVMIQDSSPILLSGAMQHSDFKHLNPTSAGMVRLNYDEENNRYIAFCYGESISLSMKPAKTDDRMIELMFNDY